MKQPWFVKVNEQQQNGPSFLNSLLLDDIEKIDLGDIAYLVVDDRDMRHANDVIFTIRGSGFPAIYILPIICLQQAGAQSDSSQRYADVYIPYQDFTQRIAEDYVSSLAPINRWISTVTQDAISADTNIAFRVLRFMESRDELFKPVTTAQATSGFVYPLLEPLFKQNDVGVLQSLEYLSDQHLVSGEFFSKAHFCGHCDCAFLNFKESCPDCHSVDLKIDELVHHFKCAYTGELSEFKQGEALVCPKCERHLRHIGVDYDKPSIVYRCNGCSLTFQNPNVSQCML